MLRDSYLPRTITINNQYDPYAAARMKQRQLSFDNGSNYVHNYGYDIIDQITSEEILADGNQIDYNSYSYNGFGDRTSGVENVTHIFDVNYPDANTIIKSSGSLTKTFTSDDRGNLISITNCQLSIINFQFDNDNNMIGAEVNGTNWTFRYNANNHYEHAWEVREENKPKILGCSRRARLLGNSRSKCIIRKSRLAQA